MPLVILSKNHNNNLLQGGLIWRLQQLSLDHLVDPLATFSVSLPAEWGMPLGWSLSFLPLSPILLGALVHLAFGARGVQRSLVSACSIHIRGVYRIFSRGVGVNMRCYLYLLPTPSPPEIGKSCFFMDAFKKNRNRH